MSRVMQLGYLVFAVQAYRQWRELAGEVLGFDLTETDDPLTTYCRLDDRGWRIALEASQSDTLLAIGWEVNDAIEFADFCVHLDRLGISWQAGSTSECRQRRVQELLYFVDPAGFRNEVFYGPELAASRFRPGRPLKGFVTGRQGLGHLVLTVSDPTPSLRFYQDALGLCISDIVRFPEGGEATFFHCNARHHSLAIATRPGGSPGVSHFMVELETLADVGCAYDECLDRQVPIFMHLGQHTNDQMVSFYLVSPSGFRVEYGYGGLQLPQEQWGVRTWSSPKVWGHRREIPTALDPISSIDES